jgi:hypothetical protein
MSKGHNFQLLRWPLDERTAKAANDHPLPIRATSPLAQFGEDGRDCGFDPQSWNYRVVQPASWPSAPACTPEQIIAQFRGGRYTQGLAMVAAWGRMWRQPDAVWGLRKIQSIERALLNCAHNLRETQSVEGSWTMLTGLAEGQMGWTAVMTSKTLHFLCRSLDFELNPPAAIDGAVMRNIVWRVLGNAVPFGERPMTWQGNTFAAYCRYMTAILVWAKQRNWTTKEMEATIFAECPSC